MQTPIILAAGIYPPEMGGVATIVYRLAEDLTRKGLAVTVIAYGKTSKIEKINALLTVIWVSRSGSMVTRYARYFIALHKHTQKNAKIFVTDILSTGLPVRILYIFRSLEVVLRLGGERSWENAIEKKRTWCTLLDYWRDTQGGWQQRMMVVYYRWFWTMPKKIIVVSDLLKRCFETMQLDTTNRMMVIPNRLPESVNGEEAISERNNHPRSPLRLLYVGRMARVKNVLFFARVIKRCEEQNLPVACEFIGEGEDLLECKKILSSSRIACFLGSKSFLDVKQRMQESDVLVLPSLSDIYPNVVIEALTQHLPVIMTDQTGLESGFGGILFASPLKIEEWTHCLQSICSTSAYKALVDSICIPQYIGPSLADVVVD